MLHLDTAGTRERAEWQGEGEGESGSVLGISTGWLSVFCCYSWGGRGEVGGAGGEIGLLAWSFGPCVSGLDGLGGDGLDIGVGWLSC